MKIGLIRHFPVKQDYLKGFVSESEVMLWFEKYNTAEIEIIHTDVGNTWQICYSSQLPRAFKTAECIYKAEVIRAELLNEPVPTKLFSSDIKLPFLLWAIIIRLTWLYNHKIQRERKEIIEARIEKFISELNIEHTEVLIVSHAFALEVMSERLLKKGFTGKKLRHPKNGELHVFEKR